MPRFVAHERIWDLAEGRPTGPLALCDRHWTMLREAIVARGLPISASAEELMGHIEQNTTGDALFDAFIDLLEHILERTGPVALAWVECPLDVMNREHEKHHAENGGKTRAGEDCELALHNGFDVWIEYAADAQVTLVTGIDPGIVH